MDGRLIRLFLYSAIFGSRPRKRGSVRIAISCFACVPLVRGRGGLRRGGKIDETRVGDRGQAADMLHDRCVDVAIETDEGQRFGAAAGRAAPKANVAMFTPKAAQRGADAADDAGNVDVAREQQRAFERRLRGHAVERQNARRAVLPDRAFDGESLCRRRPTATSTVLGNPRSRRRVVSSTTRPRAAAASEAFTRFTFSSSTEFRSADEHGAANHVRAEFRGFARVANANAAEAARRRRLRDDSDPRRSPSSR